ncbi:hypothetical protein HID58_017944 [Brassica napus]|uniref:GPN-loop GTPase 2 n=1 Tax=Brassica napus TaxID=3708 RepID=A0ABQ8DAA0_BRANA|nr:hypothetical protein HID58_017944 [Brassica napus]
MVFGQIVIGPPGSGKTTYCNGMSQFLSLIGRKVAVVNLDPANDALPYECAVNIEELIKLEVVMAECSLGPNGGLLHCMEYLEKNIDWLEAKLKPLSKDHYFLFDFPGQVELFFNHDSTKKVLTKLTKSLNLRLTAVQLIDSVLCTDPGNYVSALLLSLSTMLHMELPHINVLSKIDLIGNYGKLESVGELVKLIDKSNGYIFAGIDASVVEYSKISVRQTDWEYNRYPLALNILNHFAAVQEKYMKDEDTED